MRTGKMIIISSDFNEYLAFEVEIEKLMLQEKIISLLLAWCSFNNFLFSIGKKYPWKLNS